MRVAISIRYTDSWTKRDRGCWKERPNKRWTRSFLPVIYAFYFHHFGHHRDAQLARARHSRNTLIHATFTHHAKVDKRYWREEVRSHRDHQSFFYDTSDERSPCLTVIIFAKKRRRTRHAPKIYTDVRDLKLSVYVNSKRRHNSAQTFSPTLSLAPYGKLNDDQLKAYGLPENYAEARENAESFRPLKHWRFFSRKKKRNIESWRVN